MLKSSCINIEIENKKLSELGIKQESQYSPLRFKNSQFMGYWIDSTLGTIIFYVGAESFLCKNCKKNIEIFESLLNA